MKVKEYIKQLEKLNPEAEIWYVNDDYARVTPLHKPSRVTQEETRWYGGKMKEGDYFV